MTPENQIELLGESLQLAYATMRGVQDEAELRKWLNTVGTLSRELTNARLALGHIKTGRPRKTITDITFPGTQPP
jgi:hypothetical protein